jgi:hypothetical protein
MKSLQLITQPILMSLLCLGLSSSLKAQKLSNIQEGSVWAPANVKVDAKLNDWNDALQADNKTTGIYYTIANDSKNLYLVIKSTDQMIDNKIIAGGIDFTINTSGKKKEKDAYVITFPMVDIVNLRTQVMQSMRGPGGQGREMDSASISRMRTQAVKSAKEIKLTGFTAVIPDSVISVYNEFGIKAALDYDNKGNMILEMSVPLKYIGLTDNTKEFAYNIKLNGLNINALFPGAGAMFAGAPAGGGFGGGGGGFGGGGFGGGNTGARPPAGMPSMQDMQNIISPTDFWGKYILAKK